MLSVAVKFDPAHPAPSTPPCAAGSTMCATPTAWVCARPCWQGMALDSKLQAHCQQKKRILLDFPTHAPLYSGHRNKRTAQQFEPNPSSMSRVATYASPKFNAPSSTFIFKCAARHLESARQPQVLAPRSEPDEITPHSVLSRRHASCHDDDVFNRMGCSSAPKRRAADRPMRRWSCPPLNAPTSRPCLRAMRARFSR